MSSRRGVLAFVVLLSVLGAIVLFAALKLRGPGAGETRSRVLVFNVPADLEEDQPPYHAFSLRALRRDRPTLFEVVDGLKRAAADDHVESLVLHIDGLNWGWAKIAEVRDALQRFRASGKPLYASLEGGGEREYLLASAAGVVSMPPTAMVQLDGLAASAMFYKGTLDKLGITPNFAHVGQFKSAVEQYTRSDMSPPARAALESLLDDEYGLLVDSLAAARRLTPDRVREIVDAGPYDAADARRRGLVDTLLYDPEVDSLALRRGGHPPNAIKFTRYLDELSEPSGGQRIALVTAVGAIASGKSRESQTDGRILGSETLIEALRQARTRRSIRAIVLRIDSPGGSGQASDDIWREVARCRAVKPVIVSMSDLAASGGYYFAVAADSLVAEPQTFTGSIGVFGGKFNVLGLLHKLGLSVETVTRGRNAEMFSPFKDFSPEQGARFESHLEAFYRVFLKRVADGRHRPVTEIDALGQGRVWSGIAAQRNGLVDGLGGFDRAFQMARRRAHIRSDETVVVERFPRIQRTYFQRWLSDLVNDDDDDSMARISLPPVLSAWITAASFPAGAVLALVPYSVEIR